MAAILAASHQDPTHHPRFAMLFAHPPRALEGTVNCTRAGFKKLHSFHPESCFAGLNRLNSLKGLQRLHKKGFAEANNWAIRPAMATVTKKDLVNRLSNKMGLTQNQVIDLLETFLGTLTEALAAGDDVTLRTFGTFEVKVSRGKIGRNPNRPEVPVSIPDRCVVRFKPGQELKDQVAAIPVHKRQS
jgi:nucleoid DNA-binding protein